MVTLMSGSVLCSGENFCPNFCPPEPISADPRRSEMTEKAAERRCMTWQRMAHNPEVAGSNPAPATRKALETGPFCLQERDRYRELLPNFCPAGSGREPHSPVSCPRRPRWTAVVQQCRIATQARWIGARKFRFSPPPERRMPTTAPFASTAGPPELPGLAAASVWISS
jgi:hypothetical protein